MSINSKKFTFPVPIYPASTVIPEIRKEIQFLRMIGCVGYWDLSRDKGNKSINLMNTLSMNGTNSGTISKPCGDYFDGTDDYISIPADSVLNFTTSLSIFAFANPASDAQTGHIFTRNTDAENNCQYGLYWENSSYSYQLRGLIGDTLLATGSGTNSMPPGEFKLCGITWDGTTAKLYLDDGMKYSEAVAAPITSRDNINIGCRAAAAGGRDIFFKGVIGKVFAFNRALTQAEVTQLHHQFKSCYISSQSYHYLLDIVPNADMAISARKLRRAYTGYCTKVRRSSDNGESDIGWDHVTHRINETALLSHVGVGSGYVTILYDQTGNSNNCSQAVAASQPTIVDTGVIERQSNIPILKYISANSNYLKKEIASYSSAMTVMLVMKRNGNQTDYAGVFSNREAVSDNSFQISYLNNDNLRVMLQTNTGVTQNLEFGTDDGNLKIVTAIFDGSTDVKGYFNNELKGSATYPSGFLNTTTRYQVGCNRTETLFFNGWIGEVLLWNTVLSDDELSLVWTNLMNYYSIS